MTRIAFIVMLITGLILTISPPEGVAANLIGSASASQDGSAQAQGVILRFEPSNVTVNAGDTFDLTLELETGDQEVSGVQLFIDFDPDVLQVQDSSAGRSGVQILEGSALSTVLINAANNGAGEIDYAASKLGDPFPSGTFTVATITFEAAGSTSAQETEVGVSMSGSRETIVEFGGSPILESVENATIVVEGGQTPTSTATRTATPPPPSQSGGGGNPTRTPTRTSTPTVIPTPSLTATPSPTISPTFTPTLTPSADVNSIGEVVQAIIEDNMSPSDAAQALPELGTAGAADVIRFISIEDAAQVIALLDADFAVQVLDQTPAATLIELVSALDQTTLISLLPDVSPTTLDRIPVQGLMERLPSVDFERIAREIPPEADASLPALTVEQISPTLTRYVIPQTSDSAWTEMVSDHEFIDQAMGKFNGTLSNINVQVEQLLELPQGTPSIAPEAIVYRVFRVDAQNASRADISVVHLTLAVENAWLESNGINKWSVQLNVFDEESGQWAALPGKRASEDANNAYYSFASPYWSLFALTGAVSVPTTQFDLSDLLVFPPSVSEGEEVEISLQASNSGSSAMIVTVNLWLNDTIEDSAAVVIESGVTVPVRFQVTKPQGTYRVRIGRLEGEFSVSPGAAAQEETPTSTATLIPKLTLTPEPTAAPESTPTASAESTSTATVEPPTLTVAPTNTPENLSGNTQENPSGGLSTLALIAIAVIGAILGITLIGIAFQYLGRRSQ